jgi:hypothetical protein
MPDRGMQPLVIINFLKEVGKPILDIVHGSIFPEVDLLGFQGFDETLSRRVVVGIPLAGHADSKAVMIEDIHVVTRCMYEGDVVEIMHFTSGGYFGRERDASPS